VTIAFDEYPKMLYAPDGRQRVVHNEDDEAVAKEELGIDVEEDAPKLSLKNPPAAVSRKPNAKAQKVAPAPVPPAAVSTEAETGNEAAE
jgi:hypothetical protein